MTTAVPPVPRTALALLFGPDADSPDAIAQQIASADPGSLGRALDGLSKATCEAATREIAAATAGLLNVNLLDVLIAGWRKYHDLTSAARRTLVASDSTELLQLATHRVTEAVQPYISVLVDDHRVATLNLDLSVVFDVKALLAGIRAGRLVAVHSGHCDITATLALEGIDVVTKQTYLELPGVISLGKGVRLLPADDYLPVTGQAETADDEPPGTTTPPPGAAEARIAETERQARELVSQARADAEALVRAAEDARDRATADAEQRRQEAREAAQRAATAEARAEDARAQTTRAREDAARELQQLRASTAAEAERLRADAAREREELVKLLDDRARILTELRDEQRQRAERAERDLAAAQAELTQIRQGTGTADLPAPTRGSRPGRAFDGL